MFEIADQLERCGLRWSDDPILQMKDGRPFVPRAGVFRDEECIAVICTFPNYEMERGLTTDITNAQSIASAQTLIHLRPHAESSFVGVRSNGQAPVYQFAPETVTLGAETFKVTDLCADLPTDNRNGWNDCPLGGKDLPSFGDMESFLSWWDFHPGKQRFEIIEGQVHLAQGFIWRSVGPPGFRGNLTVAAKALKPKHLSAYRGFLVRMGETTAICPDLVICDPPTTNGSFLEAKASILFLRPDWTKNCVRVRADFLRSVGSQVAVLDADHMKFTGDFGTETKRFSFEGGNIEFDDLLAEAVA